MPTFNAIALDRLLEPGAPKSIDKSVPSLNHPPKPQGLSKTKAVPNSNLERRNSTSNIERKVSRPQISPALYATPEATPLPDSPSSFPPSPYIINHKRRGPRLLKSFSVDDVASQGKTSDGDRVKEKTKDAETKVADSSVAFSTPNGEKLVKGAHGSPTREGHRNGIQPSQGEHAYGLHDCEVGSSNEKPVCSDTSDGVDMENHVQKLVASERNGEPDDFFDPRESMSYTSNTDGEDNGAESSVKLSASAPIGEFFDAFEELSSESPQPSFNDVEAELRGIRLSLLMEIEKRKQAEENLNNVQSQWQRIREQLALVGLTLPECPIAFEDGEQQVDSNPAEELCQQVYLARLVSESLGRGVARAEVEMEMEAQIEAKNFEIARLWDRLQYYEAVNREMFQWNQEAVEMARRKRKIRKRRQRWVWGSIVTAITLGTAALAWSYFPIAKGSHLAGDSQVPPENDDAATTR
uniref:Uncharacterized protein n=1 Tax=Rhizophora mucronata TaxID=61149 RepID=A0A2P2NG53_RHIMU